MSKVLSLKTIAILLETLFVRARYVTMKLQEIALNQIAVAVMKQIIQ
jgi:hypothetical protein